VISAELTGLIHSLRSLWAIELLLLLHSRQQQRWSIDDLVVELRSSRSLIDGLLSRLHDIGLVERLADGAYRYRPSSPELEALVVELARLHAERPLAIAQAIHGGPDDKLRAFSDAFKLKKD
jgi:predicted transcriptional regulator of viral defense system